MRSVRAGLPPEGPEQDGQEGHTGAGGPTAALLGVSRLLMSPWKVPRFHLTLLLFSQS